MSIRLKLILTLLLTGVSLNAAKHTARIWDRPSVENNDKALGGYFLPLLEVTQVEIGPDKTILSFHAGYRREFAFNFTGDSYLMVDSVKYHFIYLANNSSETTWRNVIEEYNVKGENVFHYNLPGDQQSKIERALNIHEFPSYRLVDKDGTLLDINADPRMHGGIETILRNLSR